MTSTGRPRSVCGERSSCVGLGRGGATVCALGLGCTLQSLRVALCKIALRVQGKVQVVTRDDSFSMA